MSSEISAHYIGQIVWTPLPDGVHMELLEGFGFVDGLGVEWMVPKRVRVDGASIPQSLWTIVGSPFTGKYRDASVIHDYFCDMRKRPWRDVHRVFYEAMLVSGVSLARAKVMYAAVYFAGPRWSDTVVHNANVAFSVAAPPRFSRKVMSIIAVDGTTAVDVLHDYKHTILHGKEAIFDLSEFEKLVNDYDPSINEINSALDTSDSAFLVGTRSLVGSNIDLKR
jgi:hypothetical protein